MAEPCKRIFNGASVYDYTIKGNSVAVVSDGSSVLGLGNIGAEAAIPVMEGKAVLFKEFAGIDAFPICISSQNPEEIIRTVKNIAPVFGGINLEDIAAPNCFEIERKLQGVGIPVMHDDQHGTAIVVLAALLNSAKVIGTGIGEMKIVINGAGAAGTAIANFLTCFGESGKGICSSAGDVIVCDRNGAIFSGRPDLGEHKKSLAKLTNRNKIKGSLADALEGADVFIGVSRGGLLRKEDIAKMAEKPVVFALANPVPEIMPEEALRGGAAIVATGRSDFGNQVNNALVFPGVFRGLLDGRIEAVTNEMKINAAYALAGIVKKPAKRHILPSIFDRHVVKVVAKAVQNS